MRCLLHADIPSDVQGLIDGDFLPAFVPLLLFIAGLRPLPDYFTVACRTHDRSLHPQPTVDKMAVIVLCHEYRTDLYRQYGESYAVDILNQYDTTTCSFNPLTALAWVVPGILEEEFPLPGRAQVSVATFQLLMSVAHLILPEIPRLLAKYGNGSWVEFHTNCRHELHQLDARSKLRVPSPVWDSDEYHAYCLAQWQAEQAESSGLPTTGSVGVPGPVSGSTHPAQPEAPVPTAPPSPPPMMPPAPP